jgi:hypothetical protein
MASSAGHSSEDRERAVRAFVEGRRADGGSARERLRSIAYQLGIDFPELKGWVIDAQDNMTLEPGALRDNITEPSMLIKLPLWYRHMPTWEMFDWSWDRPEEGPALYAFAVSYAQIRGVADLKKWAPLNKGDWDFDPEFQWDNYGAASPELNRYIGCNVAHYWASGALTDRVFVNC